MKIYVPTKTCTQMFITSLFIIAKKWRQDKHLWIGERIQSALYIYNGILSAIKRNKQFLYMYNTSQKHCANWKKSDTKITYMIPFIWHSTRMIPERGNLQRQNRSVVARGWSRGKGLKGKEHKGIILGWWKCSIRWLWWWLFDYVLL